MNVSSLCFHINLTHVDIENWKIQHAHIVYTALSDTLMAICRCSRANPALTLHIECHSFPASSDATASLERVNS